jgi:hypothetical protein
MKLHHLSSGNRASGDRGGPRLEATPGIETHSDGSAYSALDAKVLVRPEIPVTHYRPVTLDSALF